MEANEAATAVRTVLVVDDNELILAFNVFALESIGLRVLSAPSPDVALKIVESTTPDMVVSDHDMPGLTGVEMIEIIRKKLGSHVPVVFVTGTVDVDDHEQMQAITCHVLRKPFRASDLTKMVNEALGLR